VLRRIAPFALLLAACASKTTPSTQGPADAGATAPPTPDGGPTLDAASPPPGLDAQAGDATADAGTAADAGTDAGLMQALLALTSKCNVASTSQYALDMGDPPSVDICKLNGAYFWNADMDVDCDGQQTTECNATADPMFQNQTSFNQSDGQPLNAAMLPYVVVPLPSSAFDYMAAGIQPGAAVIVLYNGMMNIGVFGDEGPPSIIGEASYAMVQSLGVDPDPANGGITGMIGVTYIVFTGAGAVVTPIEDHGQAVTLGTQLAAQLLANN
jgi:hypothetical protein